MSKLEDLIGRPLDQVSDEELEELVIRGRLAREQQAPAKEKKASKPKKESKLIEVDLDDF